MIFTSTLMVKVASSSNRYLLMDEKMNRVRVVEF
jgi:hypothetical protein